MSLSRVEAEQSRLKVWSANIGAHKKGSSSLDHRLRDASNIRNQVVKLLQDLAELLSDAKSHLAGDILPGDGESLSLDEDDSDNDSEPEPDLSTPSELSQILASVVEDINCVFRLSVSIRNPAPHDRFRESSLTDTSHFEPFDVQHVRTKFSTAPANVVERLGKAISRRRQYFKYREMHHQIMSSGLEPEREFDIALQSTVASSIPKYLKQIEIGISNPVEEDNASDTGRSQTSYATSAANTNRPKVPSLPEGAEAGPFECPFCFMMISAPSRHLRHNWADHVYKYHWKTWTCSLGCNEPFSSLKDMKHHLKYAHAAASESAHLDSLLSLCEMLKLVNESENCPLCNESLQTLKHYLRHVGRHQEDLALFALPQLPGDQDDNDSESEKDDEKTGDDDVEDVEEVTLEAEDLDLPLSKNSIPITSKEELNGIFSTSRIVILYCKY
ncbi:hypothetical protein EDB81DRAFT_663785 [Dactylonectria macrodidyma]|uniref:C2H2-type domain-containing protein n=1 Tax=Dactylonectria macrodidyma TaxID=307937 RepID=A0A9P9DX62_9HYPO|nr:hypothetical protein EDB81DRAFT_663785 [Dactylonectria macrodidyma]